MNIDELPADSQNDKTLKCGKRHNVKKIIKYVIITCVLCVGLWYGVFSFTNKLNIFAHQNNSNKVTAVNGAYDKKDNQIKLNENKSTNSSPVKEEAVAANNPKIEEWKLRLVNPWNKIPDGYKPKLTYFKGGHAIDERAYSDLKNMMEDCKAAGLSPVICSSYRTQEKQQSLFDRDVKEYLAEGKSKEEAEKEAEKWVAIPGTSEHQLGLAVDIVAKSNQSLNESQEKTAEQKWLMKNCYKYGFILRYPTSKREITGINYEPWHYRYVGKEVAAQIMQQGICFEEYLKNTKK